MGREARTRTEEVNEAIDLSYVIPVYNSLEPSTIFEKGQYGYKYVLPGAGKSYSTTS